MNHRVPDFDMADDDYSIPTSSSSIPRQQKAKDGIMELLWQNGQVVAHSQTQRSHHNHKSPPTNTPPEPPRPQPPPPPENASQLYIAEDEMATWLHYPLEDLYTDLLYPTSAPPPLPPPPPQQTFEATRVLDARPPQPSPPSKPPVPPPRNFPHFSRFREKAPTPSTGVTVVDSNKPEATPVTGASSAAATSVGEMSAAMSRAPPIRVGGGSGDMSHLTVSSSTSGSGTGSGSGSGSGTSAAATAVTTAVEGGERKQEVAEDRKRKGRETDEPTATTPTTECHTEDVEHESADGRKHSRGSAAKRSRAAEVHNLSERRRRDRINEKMRALQELIPRCNKSDKASMLDEAIEYLKSLQMQVQIMTMGCGMVPFLYPGMQQQYMPHMGMGMAMGMGMDMGMGRPMMPFPTAVPPPALPTTPAGSMVFRTPAATAAPQLAPRFPVPAFPMHPAPQAGLVGALSNQAESIRNPACMQTPALPQVANLADPYQQYLALQQMQVQMQNQSVSQPSSSKPSSSRPSTSMSEEDFDDSQCG